VLSVAGLFSRSVRSDAATGRVQVRVRRGLDLDLPGAPAADGALERAATVSSVAVLGDDAPGVRVEMRVSEGERVRLGQTLFVDRRRPQIRFTAPGAGVVAAVTRGHRRRLEAVVIRLEAHARGAATEEPAERFDVPGGFAGDVPPRETVRELLLASGLWTALRTRPFSRIPDPAPEHAPRSIFVTALESDPLAPDAQRVIALQGAEDFARGVAALAALTDGPVRVCVRPGAAPPLPDGSAAARVQVAEFAGPHPAGLPGTHIHFLDPVGPGRTVWHVSYPDVLALGRLLATGRLPVERVVALTGPSMARPRLVRTRAGASTGALLFGELRGEPCRVVSGSVLSGRAARGHTAFLGRSHTQVCALPERPEHRRGGWIAPGRGGRPRRVLRLWRRPRRPEAAAPGGWTTSLGGRRDAFHPLPRLERGMPLDLPVGPLLRALLTGDADAARELGALELAEEDLALVSFLCPAKLDHGALLRGVLDELEKETV